MNCFKMSFRIQILLAMTITVSCAFLQMPSNQFQSTFNSTFPLENKQLFKPIIIPNATRLAQQYNKSKTVDATVTKEKLRPEDTTLEENYLDKKSKTVLNPVKFSSRYSVEQDTPKEKSERPERNDSFERTNDISDESKNTSTDEEELKRNLFADRSDHVDDRNEDKEDTSEYSDEAEVAPTTNEPYSETPIPTSFRKYADEDVEDYRTTSAAEEIDSSEENQEEETEEKRSIEDYRNSGSKNYHSIQTPLNQIHYRPLHEKTRTRLVSPIERRPATHNWPYLRPQIKELEDLNEISDSDETYEKVLDVEIKKEVTAKPKQQELELAVEKDQSKFNRNKKYNYIEERNRQKERQKSLIAEEERDNKNPLFRNVKQYQVDEKAPSDIFNEAVWSTTTPKHIFKTPTTHENIFKTAASSSKKPKPLSFTKNLSKDFQNHQYLGPVVFNENLQENSKPAENHNKFVKNITKNEKLDQDYLTNQKIHKSIFTTGNKDITSFNHLVESNEMYNAILANIQSVFGLRVQPLKYSSKQKGEETSDEKKSFTWSLPLKKLAAPAKI